MLKTKKEINKRRKQSKGVAISTLITVYESNSTIGAKKLLIVVAF